MPWFVRGIKREYQSNISKKKCNNDFLPHPFDTFWYIIAFCYFIIAILFAFVVRNRMCRPLQNTLWAIDLAR